MNTMQVRNRVFLRYSEPVHNFQEILQNLSDNNFTFETLKKAILILSLAFGLSLSSSAQTRQPDVKVVKVFPNPATTYINFDFDQSQDLTNHSLKVFNFIGKKIYESNMLTRRTVVNLNDYFRGVYTYQITDRNGYVIANGKFQVSR